MPLDLHQATYCGHNCGAVLTDENIRTCDGACSGGICASCEDEGTCPEGEREQILGWLRDYPFEGLSTRRLRTVYTALTIESGR